MEAARVSETLVIPCDTTWCYNPNKHNINVCQIF